MEDFFNKVITLRINGNTVYINKKLKDEIKKRNELKGIMEIVSLEKEVEEKLFNLVK